MNVSTNALDAVTGAATDFTHVPGNEERSTDAKGTEAPQAGMRNLTVDDIHWMNDRKEHDSSIGNLLTQDDGMTDDGTKNGVASDDVMDDNNENDDSQEVTEKADTNDSDTMMMMKKMTTVRPS